MVCGGRHEEDECMGGKSNQSPGETHSLSSPMKENKDVQQEYTKQHTRQHVQDTGMLPTGSVTHPPDL